MNQEVVEIAEQERKPVTVPVAILTKHGEIFVLRSMESEKYIPNQWRFLVGRSHRGEEEAEDLVGLAWECGFRIVVREEVGSLNTKDSHFNPVRFNFYICEVVDGDFNPQIILPNNPQSHYNQFANCEGRWFKPEELGKERLLDPLVQEGLRFLNDD